MSIDKVCSGSRAVVTGWCGNHRMRRSTAPSLRQACRVPQVQEVDSSTRPGVALVRNAVRDTRSVLGLLSVARGASSESEPASSEDVSQSAREGDDKFSNRVFTVVWGKPSRRKHRTWEGDGTLHLSHNSAVLKDADGKELGRASRINTAVLEAGSRLSVGGREVELVEVASAGQRPASPAASPPAKRRLQQQLPTHRQLVMPLPSQEHQWHHNPSHGPLAVVSVDWRLCRVLRPHQREGVLFLYECVMGMRRLGHHGAVLADEMGLGKTLQTIALAWTLLKQGPYGRVEVRRILVVTPSSLVANWQREFQRWLPLPQPIVFAVDQKHKLEEFAKLPHVPVMIISYERFVRSYEEVASIQFDLLVCDEGHRLKNFSVRACILLSQLPCQRRVLLTGTPIQNHLQEFYTIVNFVNRGVLGSASEFQQQFERVITAGRQPQATAEVRALGEERAAELGRLTSWFILRRSQDVVRCYLLEKHEAILFCAPSLLQRQLYEEVMQLWEQRMDRPPPLEVITMLRKVCNHPYLLRVSSSPDSSQWQEQLWQRVEPVLAGAQCVNEEHHSGKLQVLVGLMQDLHQAGEKLVLVSGYTKTLDLLASICEREQFRFCRLDGSTPSDQRLQIVESFNRPASQYSVFLLSARAGGVGLNLTGASRLVLYDCDWNPATDQQAMARIWRDGQARPVHLYRLLTTGTIEEKMFQRQMSKTGLREAVVEPSNPGTVRLSDKELKELFSLATGPCSTHTLLGCNCEGRGLPTAPSSTSDCRDCQLGAKLISQVPGIDQLGCWQHLAPPFPAALLQEMALTSVAEHLTFIFRSSSEEL